MLDVPAWNRRFEKVECTSLDTYYFCQNYNCMFNFKVKLTRLSWAKEIALFCVYQQESA
jgi:hypothetical protein